MKYLSTFLAFFSVVHLSLAGEISVPALTIRLTSPVNYQIVQRSTQSEGELIVSGTVDGVFRDFPQPDKLEALVTGTPSFGRLSETWYPLPCDSHVAAFRRSIRLPAGGWYRVEIRASRTGTQVASVVVEHVGIGEVFVVAGQSNSANHGEERQNTKSGQVAAFDGTAWRLANDPEPGATGDRGSFMPPFGDEMAAYFHVPIGIVATGVGATSVREWLPAGTRLARLPTLTRNVVVTGPKQWEASGVIFTNFARRMEQLGTNGFRAVLWHQGESDAHQADPQRSLPGNLYRLYMEKLIHDSRQAIGWNAPWFVARASYHDPGDAAAPDIRAAQKAVCDEGFAFNGPDTDTLTGEMRERNGTGIHLSDKGLKAHAHLWFESVSPWLEQELSKTKPVSQLSRPEDAAPNQ